MLRYFFAAFRHAAIAAAFPDADFLRFSLRHLFT